VIESQKPAPEPARSTEEKEVEEIFVAEEEEDHSKGE
jgi:hypothetical protein